MALHYHYQINLPKNKRNGSLLLLETFGVLLLSVKENFKDMKRIFL
jgi:hypothetical protein